MKKITVVLVVLIVAIGTKHLKAQNFAIGGETGFSLFSGNGANFAIPLGANMEWDINGSLSLQARLAFDIGFGKNFNTFYISPEIRYHFSDVFEGAYVGGYLGFGPSSGNTFYISTGAVGGYEFMLTNSLNLDISGQLGYGHIGNSKKGTSGLHFRPTVGLRYVL